MQQRFDIYLAGPLFSAAEKAWNRRLRDYIESAGLSVFLPQELPADSPPEEIAATSRAALERSQLVIAVLDGPDADSGTAWECGFAAGIGKKVVGVRTDFRRCEIHHVNLMLHYGVDAMIEQFDGDEGRLFRSILASARSFLGIAAA